MEGCVLLKSYWARRLCWPPAGKLWISGIRNFGTLIFVIFDTDLVILNNFCRNSSFTGSVGLIIDSSRSGTCFSSCLASSIYFSLRKKWLFLGYVFLYVFEYWPLARPSIAEAGDGRLKNGGCRLKMGEGRSTNPIWGFGLCGKAKLSSRDQVGC